ncbi:Deacetylase complex subunit [Lasiodiplodia theobromae]|uniref:Uncharacterized protein n=1 Tax=Lasiodiplodia theobromae TaxID=45133 RepID=A0A5N5DPW9_9PEZI|nr:Deacetylase complex subunit [Lasiodiplodia theobromae]KAB2578794.1 hypothetical protein DBV05_g2535 [Lasiodiplodia theobromae]KAF4535441.1 Deacetylase complex subunit [Lasiodiplodia theobromae]
MDHHRPAGLSDLLDLRQTLPSDFDHKRRFTSPSPPPAHGRVDLAGSSGELPAPSPSLLPALLPDPAPVPGFATATPTPTHDQPRPDLAIAGALPCSSVSLPSSPRLLKSAPSLRLPSFDLLGIAAPHPDRFQPDAARFFEPVGAGPLSKPDDPLHARSPTATRSSEIVDKLPLPSPRLAKKDQPATTLPTPPPDLGANYWGNISHVRTTAMESPARSDPERTSPGIVPQPVVVPAPQHPPAETAPRESDRAFGWLDDGLQTIIADLGAVTGSSNFVRILSHALPCPSPKGQAFPQIIQALHQAIPPASTVWINVFHAVPGRFSMADLPTSPPSTPGPPVGGEDYFTTKVFDSAVQVTDYEGEVKAARSPRPVVPPGSVDVSIVERYIPPTSPSEFAGLYSTSGSRSLLLDRLAEISIDHGHLLFIYPTRTGGRAFMNSYLGPVLDPILRSMHVVHDLSADLGSSLGHMAAVEHLHEFEDMYRRLGTFLHHLNNGRTSDRFKLAGSHFSIVYAKKQEARLSREVWASDWWIKQEKPRVRDAVSKYFRLAHKLPPEDRVMPTALIQELLDGVAAKPYEFGEPKKGVEVGVFVIRRSR